MQEHPIPQDITGYRFHIVGSMTLKQFGEILLGVIVAVVIYNTNLTGFVKWPLILLSVGIGAAAAFVPIEERPLDHWITTFFKAIYRPTKFFWKKDAKIPEPFLYQTLASTITQEPEFDLTPAKRQRIKEYLGSVPEKNKFSSSDFSQDELVRMQGILTSFETTKTTVPKTPPVAKKLKNKPKLEVRVRSMRAPDMGGEIVIFDKMEGERDYDIDVSPEISKAKSRRGMEKRALSADKVALDIEIPEEELISLETDAEKNEKKTTAISGSDLSEKTYIENQAPSTKGVKALKDVDFNEDLPFPIKPTKPNKLVGMVLSQNNDLLTSSIVEVQTMDGHIERAVKTNALGQFFITTPLKVGEYNIVVEKDDYTFQPMHIEINDTIIQPIEIRSEN